MVDILKWIFTKWGPKGLQLGLLGYLIYRYGKAFSSDDWRERLLGRDIQATFVGGFGVPYVIVTLFTPIVIVAVDVWARATKRPAGSEDKLIAFFGAEGAKRLGWTTLALAAAYVWLEHKVQLPSPLREYGPEEPFAATLTVATGYTISCAVAALALLRTQKWVEKWTEQRAADAAETGDSDS